MKRILVTGGAGFLGSHLCDKLLAEGHQVISIDNYFTGAERNIAHLADNKNFTAVKADVCDSPDSYIKDGVDEIYNLACPASPVHYQYDAINTIRTSVYGADNMLSLAQKHGAKILQASTSEVYGDPQIHPQSETYWGHVNTIGPRSCYDEGKRCAESLFVNYHDQHKVNIRLMRIFNTYGPRMHPQDGRVVSNFIVQALKGEDITVYGDGKQTRSFCFYSDLLEGMCRLMNLEGEYSQPVNIGNPGEFTILELAEKVIEQTGTKSKIIFKPLPKDDPMQRKPDISRAKEKLSWEPKVVLDEGLKHTIEYFDQLLKA